MDGDRPVVDGRDIFESKLQELVRKVWDDARKYGNGLRYAGVAKKVYLDRYDYDIHKLLISPTLTARQVMWAFKTKPPKR